MLAMTNLISTRELARCRLRAQYRTGHKEPGANRVGLQIQKLMGKDGGASMELNDKSEVYHLRDAVWKAAGMAPFGGCLRIGCLEKRLRRQLRRTSHPFNRVLGTRD